MKAISAAAYLERSALILELRGILEDPDFGWVHQAKTHSGVMACRLILELLDRQPPALVADLEEMLLRVLEYHLQYVGGA